MAAKDHVLDRITEKEQGSSEDPLASSFRFFTAFGLTTLIITAIMAFQLTRALTGVVFPAMNSVLFPGDAVQVPANSNQSRSQ
ncbi:hypothetical protein [Leptolyngbya sp. FACHB-261]|uniref:hypothetical protein n=1 Tax=Leptolyngbya sp. FACHB-261 TaxID=2692806 RepID=UPI001688AE7F|nr:hypothetical protein [Leptolyngbya sp. FACHB-261]MBD2099909.1 hypothetical protein [Leptolyngbya sp. FACHB-261]